jgi:hypothetical protein
MRGLPAGAAPPGNVHALSNNVQAIRALPEPLHSLITGAFSQSLHDTFLSAVPLVSIALVVAFFLKERPLTGRTTPQPTEPADAELQTTA